MHLFFAHKTVWDIQLSFILNCARYTLPSVALKTLRYMSISFLLVSLYELHSFLCCFRPVHSAVVSSLWCSMKNTGHAKPKVHPTKLVSILFHKCINAVHTPTDCRQGNGVVYRLQTGEWCGVQTADRGMVWCTDCRQGNGVVYRLQTGEMVCCTAVSYTHLRAHETA